MSHKLVDELKRLSKELFSPDNRLLVMADDINDPEVLNSVADALVETSRRIYLVADYLENHKGLSKSSDINEADLEAIAVVAEEFDNTDDELLQRTASVLDQVLMNFGRPTWQEVQKEAEEAEVDKIKKEREKALDRCYKEPSETHEKRIKATESAKAIENTFKQFRPLENTLSTRHCPDHPGAQIMRIADGIYQCSLDKRIYNWNEGFETLKGNRVPGGDISEQTQMLGNRALESTHFSTRETKLNE